MRCASACIPRLSYRISPPTLAYFTFFTHLHGILLVGPLLGGEVGSAEGALAEDGARLVVLPAVGVGIIGEDPVTGNLAVNLELTGRVASRQWSRAYLVPHRHCNALPTHEMMPMST